MLETRCFEDQHTANIDTSTVYTLDDMGSDCWLVYLSSPEFRELDI